MDTKREAVHYQTFRETLRKELKGFWTEELQVSIDCIIERFVDNREEN